MASLAHLLGRVGRGIAKVPRAIEDAMTDEEIDPVTGQPFRRPSRLAQGLGEVLRAGVVAAGSPTPGAVGTAQDIFGSLKAVEADKQQRQDRATQQRQRQMAEQSAVRRDAREQAESAAELEYRQAQVAREKAAEAKANRDANKAPGADLQAKISAMEQVIGRPLNEREKQTVLGLFGPQYDARNGGTGGTGGTGTGRGGKRTVAEQARDLMSENDSFNTPEGAENDPTGEKEILNKRIYGDIIGAKESTAAPKTLDLADGVRQWDGKRGNWVKLTDENGKPFMPFVRPSRSGTGGDPDGLTKGQRYAANVSDVIDRVMQEDTAGTLETTLRNVMNHYKNDPEVKTYRSAIIAELRRRIAAQGKPKSALEREFEASVEAAKAGKAGTAAPSGAAPKSKFKEGDVVMHNGKRAMIKSFDKDGNPYIEYLK